MTDDGYCLEQSDHAFTAWLAALDPRAVQLDRAAHATPTELRMIARSRPTTSTRRTA